MRTALFGLLFCLAPLSGLAAEKFDAAARAKQIAPFLDQQAFGIVHADLSRLELGPLLELLKRVVPWIKGQLAEAEPGLRALQAALVRTGTKDVYVVVTLAPGGSRLVCVLVVPLAPGVEEKAVRAVLPSHVPLVLRDPDDLMLLQRRKFAMRLQAPPDSTSLMRIGDALLLGAPDDLARLRDSKPEPRAELAAAFEAAGDTAVQALLLPPKHFRRVIEETTAELPKELGGGASRVLTRGLLWAAIGIQPPDPAVRLVIQSEDARSAEALRAKLVELIAQAAPKVEGDRLVRVLDTGNAEILAAILRPIQHVQEQVVHEYSTNKLMTLALALHHYHDAHRQFPLPGSLGKDKKPLLSWRVQLLPQLGQDELYRQFHLDEPWDSPHNRTLIEKMPAVFRRPTCKAAKGRTNYLLPVGNGAGFSPDRPTFFYDIKDGVSNTVMIVEVDDEHAVVWTQPADWPFDPQHPLRDLGRFVRGGINTALFDGSARWIVGTIKPEILRALFTRAGGDVVER